MSDIQDSNANLTGNRSGKPDPAEIAARANGKADDDSARPTGNTAAEKIDDELGGFEVGPEPRSVLDDAEDLRLDPNEEINETIKVLGPVPIRMTPGKQVRSFDQQRDDEALNRTVRPLADKFLVSMAAMRIRLERLGLLLRDVPRQRSFVSGM